MAGFRMLRSQLDDMGYYQPLVVDAVPLVQALLNDLLAANHSLRDCKELHHYQQQSMTNFQPLRGVGKPSATSTPSSVLDRGQPGASPAYQHESLENLEVAKLRSRVSELELLNEEINKVIWRQRSELEDKAQKILQLETAARKARVVVTRAESPLSLDDDKKSKYKQPGVKTPKIEMTKIIKGPAPHPVPAVSETGQDIDTAELDVIKMYVQRNKQLDAELKRLHEELEKAKELLMKAEAQWRVATTNSKDNTGVHHHASSSSSTTSSTSANTNLTLTGKDVETQSAYLLKVLNENEQLKARLAEIEQHSRKCHAHGQTVVHPYSSAQARYGFCCCGHASTCIGQCRPVRTCCKGSLCGQDIRAAVEASHANLRNIQLCSKNQINQAMNKMRSANDRCATSNTRGAVYDRCFQDFGKPEVDDARDVGAENAELRRRMNELTNNNLRLRDKVKHLEHQRNILIGSGRASGADTASVADLASIRDLVLYLEAQLNNYKTNVDRLMDKIDPDRAQRRRFAAEFDLNEGDVELDKENLLQDLVAPVAPAVGPDGVSLAPRRQPIATLKSRRKNVPELKSRSFSRKLNPEDLVMPEETVDPSRSADPLYNSAAYRSSREISRDIQNSPIHSKEAVELDVGQGGSRMGDGSVSQKRQQSDTGLVTEKAQRTDISLELELVRSKNEELQRTVKKLTEQLEGFTQSPCNGEALQTRLADAEAENGRLRQEVAGLKDTVGQLKFRVSLDQQKTTHQVHGLRDQNDLAIEEFRTDLKICQQEAERLRRELQTKESFVKVLSNDKDALQDRLDDKTVELETLKDRHREATENLARLEDAEAKSTQRLHECLKEINSIKIKLRQQDKESEAVISKLEAERMAAREAEVQGARLRENLRAASAESEAKETQMQGLRENVQRYIREVKRIENILAARDRERSELLEQYRQLSQEMDQSLDLKKAMEAKMARLQLELSTRTQELEATESRLCDMERDLIEMSISNDSYKSQVAALSTKVDIAESELKVAKSHATWMTSDLTDINQVADQLNEQKLALQRQIAEQAMEIESLNEEVRSLRRDVQLLSNQVDQEKSSREELQKRFNERGGSGASGVERDRT